MDAAVRILGREHRATPLAEEGPHLVCHVAHRGTVLVRFERRIRSATVLRIGSIVLRVDDLQRQTEFWAAALDYVPGDQQSDDFVLLRPRNGDGPSLSLDNVPSKMQIPPRLHLDLYTEDQAGEVERLKGLGATEVHWDKRPPDADYVILADPEGNRFCVVDTTA
jgi:catechol 2,3-dioxygenase-like lactoylglutathione lyase family enzyme